MALQDLRVYQAGTCALVVGTLVLGSTGAWILAVGSADTTFVSIAAATAGPMVLAGTIVTIRVLPDLRVFPYRATMRIVVCLSVAAAGLAVIAKWLRPLEPLLATGRVDASSATDLMVVLSSIAMPVFALAGLVEGIDQKRDEWRWTSST